MAFPVFVRKLKLGDHVLFFELMKNPDLSIFALTPRELTIAPHVARGTPQKEIADKLQISVQTLFVHLKNMRRKCEVQSTAELTAIFCHYFS